MKPNQLLLELAQENIQFSRYEAETLLGSKGILEGKILTIPTNRLDNLQKLSCTNNAFQILFKTKGTYEHLRNKLRSIKWQKY